MKKDFSQKFTLWLAVLISIGGILFLLVYPVAQDMLRKDQDKAEATIKIDQNLFKKFEDMNDNYVSVDEGSGQGKPNPFK